MVDINFSAWQFSYENADNNIIVMEEGLEKLGLKWDFSLFSNNVCFTFENNAYTFFVGENNAFGISGNPKYSIGDLFLNAVNVLRDNIVVIPPTEKTPYNLIIHLLETETGYGYHFPKIQILKDRQREYCKQYEKPTLELIKSYYQDLLSVGFCEINSILVVIEFLTHFILCSSNDDRLERYANEKNGRTYNLLYSSFFHSLDFLSLIDGFQHQDIVKKTNNLAPAVFETQIGVYDNKPMILYTNIGIKALFTFDKFQLVQNGFEIRTCEVCNKYFVNADNKKYHSKVCLDCRNLSQRKRKGNNEFYLAYDRAYKAMYNRLRYLPQNGNFREEYKDNYFDPCMSAIQEKQPYYEEKNDLPGFKKFIKETMRKYKVKKE